ncbi:MAG: ABC transporter ATP-binding protein [Victivallales bacterium]|nr:ABC transporter ATP-binding protein [Victivallales bacterium]
MSFFDKTDVGRLISRCTYDAGVIDHAFSGTIAEAFIAPVQIIVAFEFLVLKAIQSGVVKPVVILVMLMPVLLFPMLMLSKIVRDYQKKVLGRVSVLVGIMQETFSGIRVVKAYNAEKQEAARFEKHNAKYFKAVIKSVLADIFMQPSMQIVAIILGSIFLILCFRYNVSIGVLGVMGLAAQNAYRPIKELAKLNINLQKCSAAAERIFEALDYDTALPEPEQPVNVEQLNDGISFEHVSFSYNENEKVIDDFSLNVKKGQFVAIVGSTGSGKSTIANLLARFYDPQEGSVKLDGVNVKDISNANLRRIIGIVAQENFLFNDTIANNIKYGRPGASDEEIADAAKRANAMEFIEASPEGFGRNVGERGCQLSGGQRQRLAIARAILRNPPILILDEATSALDTETEQAVQDAIIQLMKERTVLAIAHRLSTVVNADKIVVLEQGHIVEQGTHDELYALNGRYRALYDMQVNATV